MHQTDLRTFHVDELARVEGEGSLDVVVEGDRIVDLKFKIFESPRFFEALLRGRSHLEVTDITARICGICPVAYQTSSANAVEQALGIEVGDRIHDLRRLLYLGEWIESHALHIYFLHAPDFLGYPSGIELARADPDTVRRGLQLKKVGNRLMEVIGGREIHPVNPRVGGFWRAPTRQEILRLVPEVEWALTAAEATCDWVAGFDFPELSVDYEFVALSDPDEYAIIGGRVVSNRGIDIPVERWPEIFLEEHVEWSNALHARVRGRGSYHVGPLARYNLNYGRLHTRARVAAERAGLAPMVTNPFRSIVVRAVEVVHAAATIIDLVDRYTPPDPPYAEASPRAAVGHGASEAPRGLLYHRYQIDEEGLIRDAVIVPPTSQNQLRIEEDLRTLLPGLLDQEDSQITHRLEQAIRNYDPCISCATHFLDMRLERR